jgi:hypothetical protein
MDNILAEVPSSRIGINPLDNHAKHPVTEMVSSPAFVLSKVKLVASIDLKCECLVQLYRDLLNILLLFNYFSVMCSVFV